MQDTTRESSQQQPTTHFPPAEPHRFLAVVSRLDEPQQDSLLTVQIVTDQNPSRVEGLYWRLTGIYCGRACQIIRDDSAGTGV